MAEGKIKVVIIGAGFGGLEAAKALRRAPAEVVVIDRHNHHCFQPLLYQVATAALSPADIAWPIRHILRPQRNATVFMENVLGIDAEARLVRAEFGEVPYDYLVIAAGAQHSYFGHDEWADYASGLKRIEDATAIRRKILTAFERAELMPDSDEKQSLLTFVIVGVARLVSKWPARLPMSRDRRSLRIFVASIPDARGSFSSKQALVCCRHFPLAFLITQGIPLSRAASRSEPRHS